MKLTEPIYETIKRHITDGIISGDFKANTKVPSEHEICKEFRVSRMTANRALKELTEEGILYRIQGLGTFVSESKPSAPVLEIRNIADEVEERGGEFSSKVICHEEIKADTEAARFLELRKGTKIFHSIVIHYENDIPIQKEERFVNSKVAPGFIDIDLNEITANEYLNSISPLTEAEHLIEAVIPSKEDRKLLGMTTDACLKITRQTLSDSKPVTYTILLHPGSRFSLRGSKTY